jgi:6,7-dimethyl-8-ribityllumazine synthase
MIPSHRIAFIQASWHKTIVDQCRFAFIAEMERLGTPAQAIEVFEVPGSFELPLMAKTLALTGHYRAIVASGFVVNGGIYRHEFVADTVIAGLMQVQLETMVPIISAVLTPLNFHEHEDHLKFFQAHFAVKGREAAEACTATIANLAKLSPRA